MEINTTEHNQEYQFQYWLKLLILLHRVTTKKVRSLSHLTRDAPEDVRCRRNDEISYITTFSLDININKCISNLQYKQNYLSNSPILEIFSFIKLLQTDLI